MPPASRYDIAQDHAPQRLPTANEIKDIKPIYLEPSPWANKNYQVNGINYQVLNNITKYKDTGIASWYGQKFHGHKTSNGEVFNMYQLSAAHKTLPIPSFIKVTNLENNKSTIVRVNDRGPFHSDRILDLSYGAAYKLGVLKHGTANVSIEMINIQRPHNFSKNICKVQLAASSNLVAAAAQTKHQAYEINVPFIIETNKQIHRMLLGPFSSFIQCEQVIKKVSFNYPKAFIKLL